MTSNFNNLICEYIMGIGEYQANIFVFSIFFRVKGGGPLSLSRQRACRTSRFGRRPRASVRPEFPCSRASGAAATPQDDLRRLRQLLPGRPCIIRRPGTGKICPHPPDSLPLPRIPLRRTGAPLPYFVRTRESHTSGRERSPLLSRRGDQGVRSDRSGGNMRPCPELFP
jgi:hypothetical protein